MFDNTKEPLYVDFNGGDPDGAYWMGGRSPFLNLRLEEVDYIPAEGTKVWVSDGDVEMMGTLAFREAPNGHKYWVAIPEKGTTKDVQKDAWYHNDNLSK